MIRIRVLAFLFLLLPVFHAGAETITLTLDEAVGRALDQNLSLKKGAIDLAQSEYSAKRLWSEIFPSFSLNAGLTFLPSTPLLSDLGFSYKGDAVSYSMNLGLSFSLNPSLRSSMKRIELAYRSQLLSYENAVRQLEIQVVKNFFSLVTMKENLSYLAERQELAENKKNNDRIARANGLLNELSWLNSQLSAETARYNLINAQGAYQNALAEFLALIGMEAGAGIVLDGSFEIAPVRYDPEQLITEYLPKRPDIISQRQNIERLELAKNITSLSSRAPTLELGGQWRLGSPSNGGISDPFIDSISGTLSLRLPIDSWIPGTKQSQNVRAAGSELEKARLDLQNAETSAKTQIRSLISNLKNNWESLSIARMRVDIAQRTLDATNVGFRNGIVAFQELEDRQNDLTDARQRLLQEELTYKSLFLDLAVALNVEWKTLANLKLN